MWDELKSKKSTPRSPADEQLRVDARPAVRQIFPVSAQRRWLPRSTTTTRCSNAAACRKLNWRCPTRAHSGQTGHRPRQHRRRVFADIYMRIARPARIAPRPARAARRTERTARQNKGVVEYMMGKVRVEKEEFESGLQRYLRRAQHLLADDQQAVRTPRARCPAPADRETREAMRTQRRSRKPCPESMKNFFNGASQLTTTDAKSTKSCR